MVSRFERQESRKYVAALGIPAFLPEGSQAVGDVIAGGLDFFLQRLHPDRLASILEEQERLANLPAPIRIHALLRNCPTLHKLGQVVSRDRRLAPALRVQLQQLESMPPSTPHASIRDLLQEELPDDAFGQIQLGIAPIAEASVAVVLPFTWHRPESSISIPGVLKVIRPGVETRLAEELAIFSDLGAYVQERFAAVGLPDLNAQETFETVRELLRHEIRLDYEQANLAEAACFYRETEDVVIPGLLPHCSPRVTAMTRIEGRTVGNIIGEDPALRRKIARTIVEALILRPMFSIDATALFHADPHAGNLMVTTEGALGVVDWSLAARVDKVTRESIVQMVLGGAMLDGHRIERAIAGLSRSIADRMRLQVVVRDAVREASRGVIPGLSWLSHLLDRAVLTGGVQFHAELLLLRKMLLTLEGVVRDLDETCPVDAILFFGVMQRLGAEWPARWMQRPASRGLSTHLSNLDLAECLWTGPLTLARFWAARFS